MSSILVLGSGGMLGNSVYKYFSGQSYKVRGLTRKDFDVLNPDYKFLETEIQGSDLVLNCIGIIRQVIDNYSTLDVMKTNSLFPHNMAGICANTNIPMIHITTDCVYSGKKGQYSERDLFDADDLYGISKLSGEPANCMTLRTSIIGPETDTGVSLMSWAFSKKGGRVDGFTNHFWNGVTTLTFAQTAEKIFNSGLYKKGIFHVHSPGSISKYELLKLFDEIFNLELQITPVDSPVYCNRTLESIYPLSKSLSLKTIREQIVELKVFFNL